MTDPAPVAARASLEVARAAFAHMQATGAAPARSTPPLSIAARALEAWHSAEHVLHNVTGRVDLAGQPLIAEARRQERVTLADAHALISLSDWVERTGAPDSAAGALTLPPTDAEREVATNALAALTRAVDTMAGADSTSVPPAPFVAAPPAAESQWAGPRASTSASTPVAPSAASSARTTDWSPPASAARSRGALDEPVVVLPADGSSRSSGWIMGALLVVVLLVAFGGWYMLRGNGAGSSSATDDGIAAYGRGASEVARLSLTRAVQENPNDTRALIYLGRISREGGDAAAARRFLEAAIRVDPNNALALRELGSVLLADAQPELARRFYVRALTVDPTDHIAQGFLGCALVRLQRSDEAQRWFDRAGPGDWSACAASRAAPATATPPVPPH